MSRSQCEDKYLDFDIMPIFWHRTRRCAVPLTPSEIRSRLGMDTAGGVGSIMRQMEAALLVKRVVTDDAAIIYVPTSRGAAMAQGLVEAAA